MYAHTMCKEGVSHIQRNTQYHFISGHATKSPKNGKYQVDGVQLKQLKRQEVEKIFRELEEKRSGKYKVEQLCTYKPMTHLIFHWIKPFF